jgi:hypothetical protein
MKTKRGIISFTIIAIALLTTRLCAQDRVTAEDLEKVRGHKVTAAEVKEANDLLKKWEEYFRAMDRQKFHVKGEVVDEQGNRLTDVTLIIGTYTSGTLFNPSGGKDTERKVLLKEGRLDVSERGITSLNLSFLKDGYCDYYWDSSRDSAGLSDKEKQDIEERIMKRVIGVKSFKLTNRRCGNRMGAWHGHFAFNTQGHCIISRAGETSGDRYFIPISTERHSYQSLSNPSSPIRSDSMPTY